MSAPAITRKGFQPIAGWRTKIGENHSSVHHLELAAGDFENA
jgi:hypothetical protein